MRNVGLEAIRTFAAMMVLFAHMVLIIPGFADSVGSAKMIVNWGLESVLIFFMLSGVVIRISHDKTPRSAGQFLWTRAARLFPLYLCAVLFSVLVLKINGKSPSLGTVVGNCLFLQSPSGFIVPVIESDSALWSLAFEAFFYVAFAVTLLGPRKIMLPIWIIAATVSVFSQFLYAATGLLGHLEHVTAYSSIWLLGYYCVDLAARFRPGMYFSFACLGLLPMTTRLMIHNEYFLAFKHFFVACTAVPLFVFVLRYPSGIRDRERRLHWLLWAVAFLSLGLASYFWNQSLWISKIVFFCIPVAAPILVFLASRFSRAMKSLVPAALLGGQLSYAIYLFHLPVFALSATLGLSGVSGALILMFVAVFVACFAEFYVHPFLSRYMFPRSNQIPTPLPR